MTVLKIPIPYRVEKIYIYYLLLIWEVLYFTLSYSFQRGTKWSQEFGSIPEAFRCIFGALCGWAHEQVHWPTSLKGKCVVLKLGGFQPHRNSIVLPRGWHRVRRDYWEWKSLPITPPGGLMSSSGFFACLLVMRMGTDPEFAPPGLSTQSRVAKTRRGISSHSSVFLLRHRHVAMACIQQIRRPSEPSMCGISS